MATQQRNQENTSTLPHLRKNRHFRIKSASKDKILEPSEIMTARARHKGTDESKRIFSQSRNKKSGSIQTAIKIKITREELQKRYSKLRKETSKKKFMVYEAVRTESNTQVQDNKITARVKTIQLDEHMNTLQKMAKVSDPNKILNRQNLEQTNKISLDTNRFKKVKNADRDSKEPKGKYRCRVNQYIFEKKKSNNSKKEEETIDEFWKNVNQSLILAGRNEEEEASKDLKEFVFENFITE